MKSIVPLYILLASLCPFLKVNAQGCPSASFAPVTSFATLNSPLAITLGDFNNDGFVDIISSNVDATISIALGNGTGQYVTSSKPFTGLFTKNIANGDFNGDNKLDLVAANFNTNNIAVLPGNGDGTFGSPVFYNTASSSTAVVVGDFNNDGKLDIISSNQSDGSISVLLGTGNGSFILGGNVSVAGAPRALAAGDFNNDGKLDIVTANEGFNTLNQKTVSVLLGNGNGTFAAPAAFSINTDPLVPMSPVSIGVGDFNSDGKLDVVTANSGPCSTSNCDNVSVLLGNGNGGLGQPTIFPVNTQNFSFQLTSVAVGDVNGDGSLDLVTVAFNSQYASVLLGTGTGSFGSPVNYFIQERVADNALYTTLADVNKDGRLDIITMHGRFNISILLNTCQVASLPVIQCPSDIIVNNALNKCSETIALNATASGGSSTTIQYKIGSTIITSPHEFAIGKTIVTAIATNAAGSNSCSFAVIVKDNQAPLISCPQNMIVNPASMTGTVVSYTNPVVKDNCASTLFQTSGLSSGSFFPIGTTTNTFEARDADNIVICSFTITVTDPRCGNNKVSVCHKGTTLCINTNALDAHLSHGDVLGSCVVNSSITKSRQGPLEMEAARFSVSVLPNPSVKNFSLSISNGDRSEMIRLVVTDVLGRLVEQRSGIPSEAIISFGDSYQKGIYLVQIRQGAQTKVVKIVKQ